MCGGCKLMGKVTGMLLLANNIRLPSDKWILEAPSSAKHHSFATRSWLLPFGTSRKRWHLFELSIDLNLPWNSQVPLNFAMTSNIVNLQHFKVQIEKRFYVTSPRPLQSVAQAGVTKRTRPSSWSSWQNTLLHKKIRCCCPPSIEAPLLVLLQQGLVPSFPLSPPCLEPAPMIATSEPSQSV